MIHSVGGGDKFMTLVNGRERFEECGSTVNQLGVGWEVGLCQITL